MRQSYTKISESGGRFAIHFNNEQMHNMLGLKGRVKPLELTHGVDSTIVLDNLTDDAEKEDMVGYDEKKTTFVGVNIKSTNHDLNELGTYTFVDENGIPDIDLDKFIVNLVATTIIEGKVHFTAYTKA
ncbi:hypothetical protein Tco_0670200 [Tanacetum coccineum]